MKLLHRDNLPKGGFAGLTEHRVVKSPNVFGARANNDGSSPGLAGLVYLADATFMPYGETKMHNHHEIDVISVMVDGAIEHKGSMQNGQSLQANDVQVQRAGGEGFSHNEINPDVTWNRMIQLWVLPEQAGLAASYKVTQPVIGEVTRIYGGSANEDGGSDFVSKTKIEIALLQQGQTLEMNQSFQAYLTKGEGVANGIEVKAGDLLQDESLDFTAHEDVQVILIHH